MRAILCRAFGPIDSPRVEEIDTPPLLPGSLRIAVHAAGISFANLLVIQGTHQNKPKLPFVPGTEVGGIVKEVEPDAVGGFKIGDRICAGLAQGGFAEEAVVPAETVFRIPDAMDFATATQFPTIYATAYAALAWRAQIRHGEVLLVHGAAGASGLAAVEIGKALGASVIATAGSTDKLAVVRAHGADHAIDYRRQDFRAAVLDLTQGRGADVIFDPVGGDVFDASLRCIAPLGRILPIGFASGRIPQIPANLVLVKNISVIGLYWGFYMAWGKSQADAALRAEVRGLFAELFRLYEAGALRPVTDSVLPLADFAAGLRRVESRGVIGKVVLDPRR
ncbi:NADPH:quinone oxidoreductase family protein [Desertibaculum subflavum]|uniref:NADPH:quinone oxidoreductase family protein n=1 Tax=Desertibaculum subflavum TaxID=2268458 RepID=UPI000E669B5B